MSIESVMPSNHLILCHPLLLPSVFPGIRVFSSASVLRIRWPEYWSFSFRISHSNEYSGLISFLTEKGHPLDQQEETHEAESNRVPNVSFHCRVVENTSSSWEQHMTTCIEYTEYGQPGKLTQSRYPESLWWPHGQLHTWLTFRF